jgi:DNA-binding NarL/FixJ family response regulator
MRVLICDDHAVFADSLAVVLNGTGHTVVGVAYSPQSAAAMLSSSGVDVCLVDLRFPAGDVFDHMAELSAVAPATHFVLLSGYIDAAIVDAGLRAGIRGFAHKGQQVAEIVKLLSRVMDGEIVVGKGMAARRAPRSEAQRLATYLTPREREVLSRLARGETTAALAREMGVTASTARSHVQSVLTKLGVHSQREAVIVAARHGLVSVETGEWLL